MMFIRNPQYLLVIGAFSLLSALMLGLVAGENSILNFLEGLLIGLSISLNLAYLITMRKARSSA
ncbi:MAG: hypothetical protein GKC03_09515 [Methanomassiliicoccales archaeon]|nr:hypothetical protein [Methanomassiliicoccales archaeon]